MTIDIGLIYGVVATGIYLTFRTINFADLTCDGSFILGASVSAVLIQNGVNPYLSLIVAMATGGIAGILTGVLNVFFKVSDLLSGIIIAFMLYSINLRIMGGVPNITFVDLNINYSTIELISIIFVVTGMIIFALFSDFGLALRATGYNKKFANTSGINVKMMTLVGLTMSNSMIGLGGALFTQYQGFCDISQGTGTLVVGLASVIIGEKIIQIKKVPFSILMCVIGSILYRFFINFALHSSILGFETQDLNLITGLIIVIMMIIKSGKKQCWN